MWTTPAHVMRIPVSVTRSRPSGPTATSFSMTARRGAKSIVASGRPVRRWKPRSTSMSHTHSVSPWIAIPFGASSLTPSLPPTAKSDAPYGLSAATRVM